MSGYANLLRALDYPLGALTIASVLLLVYSRRTKVRWLSITSGVVFLISAAMLGIASFWSASPFANSRPTPVVITGNANQVIVGDGNKVNREMVPSPPE